MSRALRNAVMSGEYHRGAEVFNAMKRPSAAALRWGGVCALHLGDPLSARRCLLMAVQQGEEAARVELAICLRFEGDFAAARAQLTLLSVDRLEAGDAARCLRELAILEEHAGELAQAAALLDTAWSHAVGGDVQAQAAVSQSIAIVAATQGNDAKAQAYLRFAGKHANAMRQVYVHLAQAASAISIGKYAEAEGFLRAAEQGHGTYSLVLPLLAYRWGTWFAAQAQWPQASAAFGRAALLAREVQQPETEFYAQLGLTAVASRVGDEAAERAALARAAVLVTTPKAQAYLNWRQGAVLGRTADPRGRAALEAALHSFKTSGHQREVIWVALHLTEAHLALGAESAARDALRTAADAHLSLGGQHQMMTELGGLDRTRKLLGTLAEGAYERALCRSSAPEPTVAEVQLVTLGSPALLVNGRRARVQLRKSFEVLAFLLRHGRATRQTVQREVFPDMPATRSKNYLHQVRHELKRLVPGLSVPYDGETRTYSVHCEDVTLTWDWTEVQAALVGPERHGLPTRRVDPQDFLPESNSEWVREERAHLGRTVVQVGRDEAAAQFAAGDHAGCIRWARWLLELDPFDEGMHDLLIRATAQASGVQAAAAQYEESCALFLREVRSVPPLLNALAQQLLLN